MKPWNQYDAVLRIPHDEAADVILVGEKHHHPASRNLFLDTIKEVSAGVFAIEAPQAALLDSFDSLERARAYCSRLRGFYDMTGNREYTMATYASFPPSATGFAIFEAIISERSLAFIDNRSNDRAEPLSRIDGRTDIPSEPRISVKENGDIATESVDVLRSHFQQNVPSAYQQICVDREATMAGYLNGLRSHHTAPVVAVVGALHLVPIATRLRSIPPTREPTPPLLFSEPVAVDENPYDRSREPQP